MLWVALKDGQLVLDTETQAKNSGYGRELASFGPQPFVNAKTIWIQ